MEFLQDISLAILSGMWTVLVWTWWLIVPVIIYFARKNFKKAEYVANVKHVVLSIKIPKNNDKGPVAAEMMFASLHGILHSKEKLQKENIVEDHLSFEIVSSINKIEFLVWAPENLKDFVEGQIYAQYPTAEITTIDDYTKDIDIDDDNKDDCVAGTELTLVKDEIYPIKTFQNFDVDPLAAITGMLSKIEGGSEQVWIQILAKPIHDDWRDSSLGHISSKKGGKTSKSLQDTIFDLITHPLRVLPDLIAAVVTPLSEDEKKKIAEKAKKEKEKKEKEGVKLSHAEETELSAIEEKANKLGYKVMIRVMYLAKSKEKAEERVKSVFGAFKQFNTNNLNGFKYGNIFTGNDLLNAYRARFFNDTGFVLNIEELASLYHLPHVSVETPNIHWTSSKKGEPPANIRFLTDIENHDPEITPLGQTTFRNNYRAFGITRDDRRRHMYVIGKSGTGKSRFLEYLAIEDIVRGDGVAIVDPHGELIERILKFIPRERIDDVIYFNPADRNFPVAFNPLEALPEQREEVANGFVSVLKKLFGYSWGPRLEYVLKHTVLALIEAEGSTMLGIVRMLTDKNYRKKIVEQISDPVVQMFWLKEFSTYNDKMATETVAPILNKVGQFTASPIIRNIVGQVESKIDFSYAMNNKKIMLFNLSTGLIGEENSKLLGSMVVTKLQLAAMQRAAIPEEERKDFYLYVDEFQNFATDSFAVILSEARKYRLSLTVANQYIAQMEETVRDAVFGNVGTLISFRVGATDAAFLEKEFTPVFEQNDLINLDNMHIYITMLIDGVSSVPFSAMSLRSPEIKEDLTAAIQAVSRKKFGTPLSEVEEKIRRWYNIDSVVAGINANEKSNPIVLPKKEAIEEPAAADKEIKDNLGEQIQKQIEQTQAGESNEQTSSSKKRKKKKKSGNSINNETQTFAEKVDKETLKRIISEVVQPEKSENIDREVVKEKTIVVNNESPKPAQEIKVDKPESTEKIIPKAEVIKPSFKDEKEIKEITAENFHDLKAIHPHEKAVIKSNNAKEIKPGETITFTK